METAVTLGGVVLVENVGETIMSALFCLLGKEVFKQAGILSIKLGSKTIEYSKSFRLYMTSKLPNPPYTP